MTTTVPIDGTCAQRFAAVRDAFAENFAVHGEVGAALAVTVEGEPVVDLWAGHADADRSRPWQRDTIVNVYSTTKGMGALCAHMLVDRGLLDLDAPVATFWPEFAQNGKEAIPVRWLLSHRAGLPAVERSLPLEAAFDWQTMTAAVAAQKPWWEPGTQHGYHAFTYSWLVGEVIRRISGKSIGAFFRDEVATPLGLNAHIGIGPEFDARTADIIPTPPLPEGQVDPMAHVWENPDSMEGKAFNNPPMRRRTVNSREWRAAELVAANGHTDARSLARMYALLANRGELDGVRLLGSEAIERARVEQSNGVDAVIGSQSRFGLGFMLPSPMRRFSDNPAALGHSGMGGSLGFGDPEARLSVGYAMNQMLTSVPGGDRRWWSMLGAIYGALGLPFTAPDPA